MKTTCEISIREETFGKLRLNQNPDLLQFLKTAAGLFCEYNFTDASSAIFKLLYEDYKDVHNKILKGLGFTLYSEESFNPHVEYLFIEESSVQLIAEELLFQYMATHPCFLKVKCRAGCEVELETLKTQMANHPLLLFRAVESVWNNHQTAEIVQSCISALLAEKISSQQSGLEKLGHNSKHQQLLLPYAKAIGEFLQAMYAAFQEKQLASENRLIAAAQEELNSSPFAILESIRDKVPAKAVPVPEVKPVATVVPATSIPAVIAEPDKHSLGENSAVSPELSKFLDNKEALTFTIPGADEFWKQMAKLRNVGIDLNFLVDHLQVVLAVLSAHERYENACESLIQIDKDYAEVKEEYLKNDDIETLHKLVAFSKAREDQRKIQTSAHGEFVVARNEFNNAVRKV